MSYTSHRASPYRAFFRLHLWVDDPPWSLNSFSPVPPSPFLKTQLNSSFSEPSARFFQHSSGCPSALLLPPVVILLIALTTIVCLCVSFFPYSCELLVSKDRVLLLPKFPRLMESMVQRGLVSLLYGRKEKKRKEQEGGQKERKKK